MGFKARKEPNLERILGARCDRHNTRAPQFVLDVLSGPSEWWRMATTKQRSAYTPEMWSKTTETEVCRETKDATAGAPYMVAYLGKTITVTRRCAREMFRRGMVTGVKSCRGGTEGMKQVRADLAKQRAEIGATFDVTVTPSGKAGTWMIQSKAMNYSAPSTNPAKTIMLLGNEWWDIIDHGDGSLEAELSGDWRVQA